MPRPAWGFPRVRELGVPVSGGRGGGWASLEQYSIFASILGSPYLWKLPYGVLRLGSGLDEWTQKLHRGVLAFCCRSLSNYKHYPLVILTEHRITYARSPFLNRSYSKLMRNG